MNEIKLHVLNCRRNITLAKTKVYAALKGKGRPGGSQYRQKKKQIVKPKSTAPTSQSETVND